MPTIRKYFTFKQYREALQKFAFKQAVEVLAKLPEAKIQKIERHYSWIDHPVFEEVSNEFLVKADGPRLKEVKAYPYTFDFRLRTITVNYLHYAGPGHWHFVVEEKIYSDSPHNSKLQYDGANKEDKLKQIELINTFVDKLMEGIVPEPRFNLAGYKAAQDKKVKLKAVAS